MRELVRLALEDVVGVDAAGVVASEGVGDVADQPVVVQGHQVGHDRNAVGHGGIHRACHGQHAGGVGLGDSLDRAFTRALLEIHQPQEALAQVLGVVELIVAGGPVREVAVRRFLELEQVLLEAEVARRRSGGDPEAVVDRHLAEGPVVERILVGPVGQPRQHAEAVGRVELAQRPGDRGGRVVGVHVVIDDVVLVQPAIGYQVARVDIHEECALGRIAVLVLVGDGGEQDVDPGIAVGVRRGDEGLGDGVIDAVLAAAPLEIDGEAVDLCLVHPVAPDKRTLRGVVGNGAGVLDHPVGMVGHRHAGELMRLLGLREFGEVRDCEEHRVSDVQGRCSPDSEGRQQEHRQSGQEACPAGSRHSSHTQPPQDRRQRSPAAGIRYHAASLQCCVAVRHPPIPSSSTVDVVVRTGWSICCQFG